ncbi:sulfotransferase family 2 domain-containing protein [Halodurantibacterium flavum]|uniref:Sulfotransferase family 2 domain-containing protein n=1 Tax=Halodurantibacterium flavum TaxID=1382802 RepID=A0ABW4S9I1_9RHOB
MRFSQLNDETVHEYLSANTDSTTPWIFQHIPKTAGSSLTAELSRHRSPYVNLFVDDSSAIPYRQQMMQHAASVEPVSDGRPLRSLSGHFTHDEIDVLQGRLPDARLFTFVRSPVERVISDFRYSRTPQHPDWRKVIEDFPTLDAFIEHSSAARNQMAFFMLGVREGDPTEIATAAMKRFNFVGSLDSYDVSFRALSLMLWTQSEPTVHARPTRETAENKVEITNGQIARIKEQNALDQAIFNRVTKKLSFIEQYLNKAAA